MKIILTYIGCLSLASCALVATNPIQPDASSVRLYEDYSAVKNCQFVQEIIGTEGHWYNSLFIANKNLIQGAVNDLKNQTHELGANSVYTHRNFLFSTSVTILGQAYNCK